MTVITAANGESYVFPSFFFVRRITQKLPKRFAQHSTSGKVAWAWKEAVRAWRVADLTFNKLKIFGIGAGSRSPSASILIISAPTLEYSVLVSWLQLIHLFLLSPISLDFDRMMLISHRCVCLTAVRRASVHSCEYAQCLLRRSQKTSSEAPPGEPD